MQRIYTNENRFQVDAIRNYLEENGVPTMLRNEFTSSIMGEVPFFDTWPEIWVADDWAAQAKRLIERAEIEAQRVARDDWLCEKCEEQNPGSFDLCWNCQVPNQATLKA